VNNTSLSQSFTGTEGGSMNRQETHWQKRSLLFLLSILLVATFQTESTGFHASPSIDEMTEKSSSSDKWAPPTQGPSEKAGMLNCRPGMPGELVGATSDRIKEDPKAIMVAAKTPKRSSANDCLEGNTYSAQTNIWYENPKRIYSTNYHVGAILPVGTEVQVIRLTDHTIEFRAADTGTTYKMTLLRKHKTITLKELFDLYFSEEDVLDEHGKLYHFTEEEREDIKNGSIAPLGRTEMPW